MQGRLYNNLMIKDKYFEKLNQFIKIINLLENLLKDNKFTIYKFNKEINFGHFKYDIIGESDIDIGRTSFETLKEHFGEVK